MTAAKLAPMGAQRGRVPRRRFLARPDDL